MTIVSILLQLCVNMVICKFSWYVVRLKRGTLTIDRHKFIPKCCDTNNKNESNNLRPAKKNHTVSHTIQASNTSICFHQSKTGTTNVAAKKGMRTQHDKTAYE